MQSSFDLSFKKLTEFLKKNNELSKLVALFNNEFKLTPCFGVEIEFYLSQNIDLLIFEYHLGLEVKEEKGKNQFEIDLFPSKNLENYAKEIEFYKDKIIKIAHFLGGKADLSAKPYTDDYGNSMHFHLNFIEKQDKEFTQIIANILCNFMLKTFLVFMPKEGDYARIDKDFMTPTSVSFGGNNRSVAVRIPDSLPMRIEHRVSSALADPYLVMYTILKSVYLGLKYPKQLVEYKKIYGNAYDLQYNQLPFPKSKAEAEKLFNWQFFE